MKIVLRISQEEFSKIKGIGIRGGYPGCTPFILKFLEDHQEIKHSDNTSAFQLFYRHPNLKNLAFEFHVFTENFSKWAGRHCMIISRSDFEEYTKAERIAATAVLLTDDYLNIKTGVKQNLVRYWDIMKKLGNPDLQGLLANRTVGRTRDTIPNKNLESACQELAYIYQTEEDNKKKCTVS